MPVWLKMLLEILAEQADVFVQILLAWIKDYFEGHKPQEVDGRLVFTGADGQPFELPAEFSADAPPELKAKLLELLSGYFASIDRPVLKRLALLLLPLITNEVIDTLWDRLFAAKAGGKLAAGFGEKKPVTAGGRFKIRQAARQAETNVLKALEAEVGAFLAGG